MPFKVENEVDFMYGSERSNQPVFKVKSRLGFKFRYRSARKLEIITSEEKSALNPMIEIPLTAGTQVDKWRMQKLENENILRHYEIKSNRLIMYLSDLQKGERLNFAVLFQITYKASSQLFLVNTMSTLTKNF